MKKLITIVLLAALAVPVAAQELFTEELAQPQPKEQKWTIRGSAGYYPTVPTVALPFIAIGIGLANQNNETEKTDITFPPFCQVSTVTDAQCFSRSTTGVTLMPGVPSFTSSK